MIPNDLEIPKYPRFDHTRILFIRDPRKLSHSTQSQSLIILFSKFGLVKKKRLTSP